MRGTWSGPVPRRTGLLQLLQVYQQKKMDPKLEVQPEEYWYWLRNMEGGASMVSGGLPTDRHGRIPGKSDERPLPLYPMSNNLPPRTS